jgi:DNA mismatch repair protein MutS
MKERMKQFYMLKDKHPDALLLFRCGDFYESYKSDAKVCANVLGLPLTKINGTDIEMCAFHCNRLMDYLAPLIRAGKRIAICDQLVDPKLTKKLVKRGITE